MRWAMPHVAPGYSCACTAPNHATTSSGRANGAPSRCWLCRRCCAISKKVIDSFPFSIRNGERYFLPSGQAYGKSTRERKTLLSTSFSCAACRTNGFLASRHLDSCEGALISSLLLAPWPETVRCCVSGQRASADRRGASACPCRPHSVRRPLETPQLPLGPDITRYAFCAQQYRPDTSHSA